MANTTFNTGDALDALHSSGNILALISDLLDGRADGEFTLTAEGASGLAQLIRDCAKATSKGYDAAYQGRQASYQQGFDAGLAAAGKTGRGRADQGGTVPNLTTEAKPGGQTAERT